MGYVKELTDFKTWDSFVESSEQGTVFSTTKWLTLFDLPFKIYGYYKSGKLFGGMANFNKPAPLTPFQGILISGENSQMKYSTQMSLHNEVSKALIEYAPNQFYNHWQFPDIRVFKWANWQVDIRYTYVVDLTDMDKLWEGLEKQTRYEINHARKTYNTFMTSDVGAFNSLYSETFKRKGIERPVNSEMLQRLCWVFNAVIFCSSTLDSIGSMAVVIEDNKRAYYLLGASDDIGHTSSLTLWTVFEKSAGAGIKEIDLVGCNNEQIGMFKRGFGGYLTPYFGVTRRQSV